MQTAVTSFIRPLEEIENVVRLSKSWLDSNVGPIVIVQAVVYSVISTQLKEKSRNSTIPNLIMPTLTSFPSPPIGLSKALQDTALLVKERECPKSLVSTATK